MQEENWSIQKNLRKQVSLDWKPNGQLKQRFCLYSVHDTSELKSAWYHIRLLVTLRVHPMMVGKKEATTMKYMYGLLSYPTQSGLDIQVDL